MVSPTLLAFGGGVLVGLLLMELLRRFLIKPTHALPAPQISLVRCVPPDQIEIQGSIGPAPAGAALVALHVKVYDDPAQAVPDSPLGEGATPAGTSFPIVFPAPAMPSGPPDLVAVWAEYQEFHKDQASFTCPPGSGSGSGSGPVPFGGTRRALPAGAAEQLEAFPRAYRVSPASSAAEAGGGLAADLAAGLARAPETVLRYVPEASTPTEPLWRARGGPEPAREWTLRLLHGPGGFGAVLSVDCLVGGREVRASWVTSNWRFHEANRLACESGEAGGPPLLVQPA